MWHLCPPLPPHSTFVSTQVPFRPVQFELALRSGGRIVTLVREKRAEAEMPDFIDEFGKESYDATFIFREPEPRNRWPGDVLGRMLALLGRTVAKPHIKLNFTFVNTEAWSSEPRAQLCEKMRAASGMGEEEFARRVRCLSLDEYAAAVGRTQFSLELGLEGNES
jgi:hypothetical protein